MPGSVVLVHGAMHGSWCWQFVLEGLEQRGVRAVAVDLPGRGANVDRPRGLSANVVVVEEAVAALRGPVVLCGHSIAGETISFAAERCENVRQLVYLAALLPRSDELMPSIMAEAVTSSAGRMQVTDGKVMVASFEDAVELMYHDCSPDTARWAYERLIPELAQAPDEPTKRIGRATPWESIATAYVICAKDRGFSPHLQRRLATRTSTVVEWPTSHSPFLSRPALVVELLARLAGEVDGKVHVGP
jgi:pimeloyl-ACP methyl ester carboxylesterase